MHFQEEFEDIVYMLPCIIIHRRHQSVFLFLLCPPHVHFLSGSSEVVCQQIVYVQLGTCCSVSSTERNN